MRRQSLLPLSLSIAVSSIWFLCVPLPHARAAAASRHPFTVHDLLAMDRVREPQISPDGKQVVFALSRTDLEANRRRSDLWVANVEGSGARRITSHESGSDNSARWAPDSRTLYFLSSRSGTSQVWRIASDGGEAEQVTKLPLDVGGFLLSPDGKRLAVALEVFPDCSNLSCTKQRLDEQAARKATGRIYDGLFVRHWDTFADGRRSHVFVMPTEAQGEPTDLMKGMNADCPSKPWGGMEEVTFTPDGKGLVFATRNVGREEAWSTNFDLYLASVDGKAQPKNLTAANPAWDTQPLFSPDGKTLAYLAMKRPGYEADRYQIVLRSWPDGRERKLAEQWDRSPASLAWSPDGKTIYAIAEDTGQQPLFAIDVTSGEVRKLYGEGVLKSASVAQDRIVFSREHLRSPAELMAVRLDGSQPTLLTHINDARVQAVELGEPKQFSFKGWNDETVWGFVVKPAGFVAGKKYPVALLIHGGPQGSFSNDFHYRWNPQTYAGAGFGVITIDFHGSTGYGQAFTDSIAGDWGGKPLEDLKRGLAAALAENPWMDTDRVCALGASFGGYMINWIAGNWPDRFRCLVSHDGNLDERAAYFDTEELWFPEHEHEGTPWSNRDAYEKHNPVNYVGNWRTPMLVVHGGKDFRVVETQGLSTFNALQRRGIPSKLLYFPDENHWVLRPHNSVLWHETVLGWLKQWTSGPRWQPAAGGSPLQVTR